MLQCVVFNVRLGQCVGFFPKDDLEYSMLVDCGHEGDFHPIDFIKANIKGMPLNKSGKIIINNLTLTNYDHDHFSGLPYLMNSTEIKTVRFPKNLSIDDLKNLKDDSTEALEAVFDIKSRYTATAQNYNPPYVKKAFSLTQDELRAASVPVETNHLSQLVFVTYGNRTICITGDLEKPSWELMLKKTEIKELLKKTNIFFASHHGRLNGYCSDVFNYCKPECIIISDKEMVHGTQENMSQVYSKHVYGNGIQFASKESSNIRKVITTRSDGHISINIKSNGIVEYISI